MRGGVNTDVPKTQSEPADTNNQLTSMNGDTKRWCWAEFRKTWGTWAEKTLSADFDQTFAGKCGLVLTLLRRRFRHARVESTLLAGWTRKNHEVFLMRLLRFARWLLPALLFSVVPIFLHAQILVSVSFAPLALPEYEQPICPQPNLMWTPGYWDYADGDYYWVPGAWVPAPL